MKKHTLFLGRTEAGVFAQGLFSGALEKTAGVQGWGWDSADDIRKFIRTVDKGERKKNCYVLVNALGGGEWFGSNINADYFPWNALAHEGNDYGYKTFLNAHAFAHHVNKDPAHAFGVPVLSVLNPRMKRVELIIKLDREKARKENADGIITRIDSGEFPDVSMGCAPKGSPILLADGRYVPIETVKEGDLVVSHRGIARRVVSTMVRPHKGEIFYIKAYGTKDPLILTEEHPLWLLRAEQVACHPSTSTINNGRKQQVCVPNSPSLKKGCEGCETEPGTEFSWVRTDEARIGDYLATPLPSFETSRSFSPDEARLLGYYLSEGLVLRTKAGSLMAVQFCTGLHETETHAEIFAAASRLGFESVSELDVEERNGKYITIYDKGFAALCLEHCGEKSKTKTLSSSIMGANEDTLQIFLGAYANGDGGCYKGSIYLSTASEQLAKQLRLVLLRCRMMASVNVIQHRPGPKSVAKKETTEYQVWIGTDSSWKFIGSRHAPERSKKLCSKRFFLDHDGVSYLVTPIESIERVDYDDQVFNFGVETDDSYLMDGLAVHNCRVPFDICSVCGHKSKTRDDYCFPPGTPILVEGGQYRPIETLNVGDLVVTHAGNLRRITHLLPSAAHDGLVRIEAFGFGTIEATPNHPFFTARTVTGIHGGRAAQLDVAKPDWRAAEELQPNDTVFLPIPKLSDEEMEGAHAGWLLGIYLAEGCPTFSTGVAYPKGVNFSLHFDEKELQYRIERAVAQLDPEATVGISEDESRTARTVRVKSRKVAEWLLLHGGRGSKTKTLNPAIWSYGRVFCREVLKGWAEGDGSYDEKMALLRVATSSETLARQAQLLAASCGVLAGVKLHSRETNFANQDIWYVSFAGDAAKAVYEVRPQVQFSKQSKLFFWGGYLCSTVKSVEAVEYEGPIYNFEVEDDHSYVAGCYAVHNCIHMRPPPELREFFGPNRILPDGTKIFVLNTLPRFFDISFVFIGADKTAKVMAKLASRGSHVCLGSVCVAVPGAGEAAELVGHAPPSALLATTKTAASHPRRCGSGCIGCGPCSLDKVASAFGVKQAETKLSELVKSVPAGTFSMRNLPSLEAVEPDLPDEVLDRLAEYPLPNITGAATSAGVVLKPREFQRIVLIRMGDRDLADELDQEGKVFRPVHRFDDAGKPSFPALPELLRELLPFIGDRSAYGPPLSVRILRVRPGPEGKKTLPTSAPIEHPLLDKIGAAYNGYRRHVLTELSQAKEEVSSDSELREAILGDELVLMFSKKASPSQLVTSDSVAYMMSAHLSDRRLLSTTAVADAIAVANPWLREELSA